MLKFLFSRQFSHLFLCKTFCEHNITHKRMVKNGIALVAAAVATWNGLILDVDAFATPATGLVQRSASSNTPSQLLSTATAETSAVDSDNIPTNLPSECGMDYIPLATMLATEDLAGADQVCFNRNRFKKGQF